MPAYIHKHPYVSKCIQTSQIQQHVSNDTQMHQNASKLANVPRRAKMYPKTNKYTQAQKHPRTSETCI